MKKILVGLFLSVLCSVVMGEEQHDFRKVNFGWSLEQVLAAEDAIFQELEDLGDRVRCFTGVVSLFGKQVPLGYYFADDRLYQAYYLISEGVADETFLALLIKTLSAKYGQYLREYPEEGKTLYAWISGDHVLIRVYVKSVFDRVNEIDILINHNEEQKHATKVQNEVAANQINDAQNNF